MAKSEKKVSKDMTFGELLQSYPDAAPILSKYGLHCVGCRLAVSETLEQGMRAHGRNDANITELLDELNSAIA